MTVTYDNMNIHRIIHLKMASVITTIFVFYHPKGKEKYWKENHVDGTPRINAALHGTQRCSSWEKASC